MRADTLVTREMAQNPLSSRASLLGLMAIALGVLAGAYVPPETPNWVVALVPGVVGALGLIFTLASLSGSRAPGLPAGAIREAGDETFWLKAVSPAGLFSASAAYATTRLAPTTGRNMVLASDRRALGWPGITQGLEVIGGNLLALTRTGATTVARGEYVFPIALDRSTRARKG
jgi:hypothetical protein